MEDFAMRKRGVKTKLTAGQVMLIRERDGEGNWMQPGQFWCRAYGISIETVRRIRRGEAWAELDSGLEHVTEDDRPEVTLNPADLAESLERFRAMAEPARPVEKKPEAEGPGRRRYEKLMGIASPLEEAKSGDNHDDE